MIAVTRARGLRLTAKLTVPFAVTFVAALTLLVIISTRASRAALVESLETRAQILVSTLVTTLAEPMSMGELDRLQALVVEAKKADPDAAYVVLVNAEGKAVAATETGLKNQVLARNEFEKAMSQASAFTRRPVPTDSDLFEVAMPVTFQGAPTGVLRIGLSTRQVRATALRGNLLVALVGAVALVAGILVYVAMARRAARPLRAAVERLEELASGDADLTQRLPVTSTDEVGQIAVSLNRFLDNLEKLVCEIRETSGHVGSASRQLSLAAQQLSGSTQEQAASLEETTASLGQITGTVKQTADNARRANELARGSRDTANKGGQVVTTAVTAMEEINRASTKIGDIITTIDEIAFQTNLLALNAAVEAARAGEQGRGFAVVAAEVRNLAQRSATAAREIKGLIKDSVGKVDAGSALVGQSGRTLGDIVASVKRVTDIIAEIAATSHEQSSGIDQVNRAITEMDRVVQANAAQTEQLSSTAQALAGQAVQLQALVGRFKLEASTPAATPAPVRADAAAPPIGRLGPRLRHPVSVT